MDTPHTAAALAAGLATAGIVVALVVSGCVTARLLHDRDADALDATLIVKAHQGRAAVVPGWAGPVGPTRVRLRNWEGGDDPLISRETFDAALASGDTMQLLDIGERRVLLFPGESSAVPRSVFVAEAPRVRFADSVGAFGAIYSAVSLFVSAASWFGQRKLMGLLLRPLARAGAAADHATAVGSGFRLVEEGPVEIRAMLSAFNALLGRLEMSTAAQTRFTTNAAHELRTPIAAIRAELDFAVLRDRSAREYREALVAAGLGAARLGELVDGLLSIARVDAGQGEQDREREHASALAQRAACNEAGRLEAVGCSFRLHIDGDAEIEVHVALVTAAITNLLRNAARYAPGAPVALRLRTDPGAVHFEVDDSGPGVAPEARDVVFDRFARGPEARRIDPAGLGLGLPFAREVAMRHGGDCRLSESPTGGCRASLTITRRE